MDFNIFKLYKKICIELNTEPSFEGLDKFRKFYLWECGNNGRG